MWNVTLLWPRYIWCQGHPSNLYLIAHYFPKHMVTEWRKSVALYQRYSMFSLFHATHFQSGKGRLSCAATNIALPTLLLSQSTSIIICKTFWKCWVISEIHNIFFVFHSTWKRWKMEQHFWKQRQWQYDAEFGYRLKFLITYYHQRDLTLGVYLEIFACQKWAFL